VPRKVCDLLPESREMNKTVALKESELHLEFRN
jgi:hypothetical protein